ncbi:MAG: MMPL family transporter [Bacillus sp. (in: Bacteria)]|nr:MMPL family transporter [Bacillus sp. (in: firmicutes)]
MVILYIIAPSIDQFVREEGEATVPSDYPSALVDSLLESDEGFVGSEIIIVYHTKNSDPFTTETKEAIEEQLKNLEEETDLPLHDVITPFDDETTEEQLISEEEDVLLAILQLDIDSHEYRDLRDTIQEETKVGLGDVVHYQTGEVPISEDVIVSTERGLERSTYITVIFVFLVLLIVFRSPFAPIIPLLILGTVYLVSVSVVAILIDTVGFPVSEFTQIFILTVVFGVGTDYCILIMQYFKEKLKVEGVSAYDAMKQTMKQSNQSVLYSALTGFIGFATIGLADFSLYQSAVGVAISVLFIIVALWVFFPFVLYVFGKKIFWPARIKHQSTDSALWDKLGYFSLNKTKWAVCCILFVTIPLIFLYDNARSFNNLDEIQGDFDSVRGFDIVTESFGEGDHFASTLMIEANSNWRDTEAIPHLEFLSMNLEKIEHVKSVQTISRPEGSPLNEATVPYISDQVATGLDETIDGMEELKENLNALAGELADEKTEMDDAQEGKKELIEGTNEAIVGLEEGIVGLISINEGLTEATVALGEINSGQEELLNELNSGMAMVGEVEEAIEELVEGLELISNGIGDTVTGLTEIVDGLGEAMDGMDELEKGQSELIDELKPLQSIIVEIEEEISILEKKVEALLEMISFIRELIHDTILLFEEAVIKLRNLEERMQEDRTGMEDLINEMAEMDVAFPSHTFIDVDELSSGLGSLAHELEKQVEDLREIDSELIEYEKKIAKFLDDVKAPSDMMGELLSALKEMREGTKDLQDGLKEITDALNQTIDGLEELEEGIEEVHVQVEEQFMNSRGFLGELELLIEGIEDLKAGTNDVKGGIGEASAGLDEIIIGFYDLLDGLHEINAGQKDFLEGLNELGEMLSILIGALEEFAEGTVEMSDGMLDMQDIVSELADQGNNPLAGFVILEEMLDDAAFDPIWKYFTTPGDQRVAFVDIVFDVNPYSQEAMDTLDEVEEVTLFSFRDTYLEEPTIAIEGITSSNRDLRDVSDQDFYITASIMLVGIFIALAILFKSIFIPIYVIVSLVVTYICAMSITELIFVDIYGYAGVMWATPFFGFVLLMALGVDYSIFLLGRLNQSLDTEKDLGKLIHHSMKKIGRTVLSAAVILGGTFATLLPSGVLSLMQISTIVISGLFIYTFVMLPLFVPIMFKWIGKYNWWPFTRNINS